MKRRQLIHALGATVCVSALPALAQQPPKVWRIGFLTAYGSRESSGGRVDAFLQGLRELGYVEGKNIAIEWRFAGSDYARLPGLAAELVREKVDIIVTSASSASRAAQKATGTIPIVALGVGDPVGYGLAASMARPGGNITGFSIISPDIIPKRLELLLAIVPQTKRIGVLGNPDTVAYPGNLKSVQAAGQKAGVNILPFNARTPEEIERSFAMMAKARIRAAVVFADALFIQQTTSTSAMAIRHRMATMYSYRVSVEAGGLMSYGPDDTEAYRRGAIYVDKIIKGAKAGELPFEQPAKFHLVINGKTAKTLGLKISQELLLRADEVIE